MSRARRASPLPAALRSAAMMSHTHTRVRRARRTVCSFWQFGATIDPQKNFFQNRRSRAFRRLRVTFVSVTAKVPTGYRTHRHRRHRQLTTNDATIRSNSLALVSSNPSVVALADKTYTKPPFTLAAA